MYARGMFIRQVLRGVVLLKLRVACVPLPVDYSRLKTDDTFVFKNQLLPPHLLAPSSLAPSSKPHIKYIRERRYELRLSLAKHRHLCHTSSVDHHLWHPCPITTSHLASSVQYCCAKTTSTLARSRGKKQSITSKGKAVEIE